MRTVLFGVLMFCVALLACPGNAETTSSESKEFALRDGDTVVFLGDSITAAQQYGKIVENYTLLRFPDRTVRFFNAGWGGDTAEGGLKRLQRDVIDRGATVLTVAYGVNDIGWGMWADEEHKQRYLKGIRGIVEACKAHNIRVFICSPAPTASDPFKNQGDFLQKMTNEGMAISRSLGEGSIDVLGSLREIQKKVWKANEATTDTKKRFTLHAEDTVHLNDYGQIAMAYAILKGLGAPAEVSSAEIDAKNPKTVVARNCKISDLSTSPTGLQFVRLDQGLPITLGLVGHIAYWHIPIPNELARYWLTVKGLEPGKYKIQAEERLVGTYTDAQLAEGINLGNATPNAWIPGGPWDAQSTMLRSVTEAKFKILDSLRDLTFSDPTHPDRALLTQSGDDLVRRIEKMQRDTARPVPYHFVVNRAESK